MTSASTTSPDFFAPRRVGDHSSATPECRRPEQLTVLEPGATIAERWELPFDMSRTLREVGSDGRPGVAGGHRGSGPERDGVLGHRLLQR